jgi:WXG100 family type VII secretion target
MMPGQKMRADFDQLSGIVQIWARQSDAVRNARQNLLERMNSLRNGDWVGESAEVFYTEMDSVVLPAMDRTAAALEEAARITSQIRNVMQQAEIDTSQLWKLSDTAQKSPISSTQSVNTLANTDPFNPLTWALAKSGGVMWALFKERFAIKSFITAIGEQGGLVRFIREGNGIWRVLGSRAAKAAAQLPPYLTRFSESYLKTNLSESGGGLKFMWKAAKVAVTDGPFSEAAKDALTHLRTPTLTAAQSFKGQFAGMFKGGAIFTTAVSVLQNLYEYGLGDKKDLGLGSRQFFTSTTADVVAGVGIVGASAAAGAAIGTLIPVPGVGTLAGFLVGAGVGYLYESHLKDDWHEAVDGAGEWLVNNAPKAAETAREFLHDVSRGAIDFMSQLNARFSLSAPFSYGSS